MKTLSLLKVSFCLMTMIPMFSFAQNVWPKSFTAQDGKLIKVYQWQPESFSNGTLQANAAISVTEKGKSEPSFGMVWLTASTFTNGQQVTVDKVEVNAVKLPDAESDEQLSVLQADIANGLSNQSISIAQTEINNALQANQEEQKTANQINNKAPKIIYSDKPSLLVVMDGAPRLQQNSRWGMETVINTPFTILKNRNTFFLFGGKHWYAAPSATGPYRITTNVPADLEKIQSEIAQANSDNNAQQEEQDFVISNIIVTTDPAELLQSNGEPDFSPIPQTNLLYVRNSNNDIFMDINSQQYYILLSGRWYKSQTLSGKWSYVASDRLPADFAKIPEGSAKDNVLSSVAGTLAANDAVMNAQVPQTARVDRRNTKAEIQYDGEPQFNGIEGTDMDYAVNTPDYVIRWRGNYYAVDNGVWFQSYYPNGPWVVSPTRPYAVSLISPRYPVYAMKYVYIYDVTPDYIYMGYTPGYLNTFIYGPTVVYGTGYYYRPWVGRYFYARPYTWGFNMQYNPWTGWGFGFNYNLGWFHFGMSNYNPWAWGGWWGPAVYRPAYFHTPYSARYRHGYYGAYAPRYYNSRNTVIVNNINIYHNNNIYNNRRDVVTRDNRRIVSYNRNSTSAPVRNFNTARPAERNAGRITNGNAQPTERTTAPRGNSNPRVSERNAGRIGTNNSKPIERRGTGQGNISPRSTERRVPSNGNSTERRSNLNSEKPSRNFQGAFTEPQSRPNRSENFNTTNARRGGNVNDRLLADRRENTNVSSSPAIRRNQEPDAIRPQQRSTASPQRGATEARQQAPIMRRNIEPARSSAPQREIRSGNSRTVSPANGAERSSISRELRTKRG